MNQSKKIYQVTCQVKYVAKCKQVEKCLIVHLFVWLVKILSPGFVAEEKNVLNTYQCPQGGEVALKIK